VVVDGVRRQNLRPFLADTAMQIAHKVAAHCPKPQETVLGQRSGSRNSAFRFSRHPEAHPRALISCSQRPEGRQLQSLGHRPRETAPQSLAGRRSATSHSRSETA